MKKLLILISVCIGFSGVVHAGDLKIGVMDQIEALTQSSQAKAMIGEMKKSTAADEQKLKALEGVLQKLSKQLETDGAVMSAAQKQKTLKELDNKKADYSFLRQKLQNRYQDGQQNILTTLAPKFKKAVEQVIKQGHYDLVIQRQALIYSADGMDITAAITAAMNAMK